MYVITVKESNVVAAIGNGLAYQSNGYPVLTEKNIAYVPEHFAVNEVAEVPDGIEEHKYCYTQENGFYKNPNYTEPNPYGIPDEVVNRIINDTNLYQEGYDRAVLDMIESGVL